MEIFVATGNAHKLVELTPLFPGHVLKTPADAGFSSFDVVEDGLTYLDNALKKALALFRLTGRASLADDSGLSVRALDGGPGIRSARYGSLEGAANLSSAERNAFLLRNTEAYEDRACAFVCCLVLVLSETRSYSIQETMEGELLRESRGSGGFGYDPVVFLPSLRRSVAELSAEEKNRLSHRGRASRRMAAILSDLQTHP